MKLIILMILPLFILAFIPSIAKAGAGCGSNWLGSDVNDQDFWVSKNQNLGSTNVKPNSPRLVPDERSKANPNPLTLNISMPLPNQTPSKPVNKTINMSFQRNNASYGELTKPDFPDLNGKWYARFEGNDEKSMDFILIQTKENIIGSGTLNEEDNALQILAKGSLDNKNIMFDVKTVVGDFVNKIDKRYKLTLILNNQTLSGKYEEYLGEISVDKGNITVARYSASR